jgi:hypothetical protein
LDDFLIPSRKRGLPRWGWGEAAEAQFGGTITSPDRMGALDHDAIRRNRIMI